MLENYFRSRGQGFGEEVKRRIMLGTYALSEGYADQYYRQAQKVRTLIEAEFDEVFQTCDALVSPVSPIVAFPLGQKLNDPYQMYLCDVCTIPANIAGLPGIPAVRHATGLAGWPAGDCTGLCGRIRAQGGLRVRAERSLRRGKTESVTLLVVRGASGYPAPSRQG